jgi:hypothetical protein
MPREITHWTVLERAVSSERCPKVVKNLYSQHRAAFYLGAMTHDASYYYQGGGSQFEQISKRLHGSIGEDTLQPLQELLDFIDDSATEQSKPILWAFVLGMLTHYATDVNFHPLVFYFTGDYHHPDREIREEIRARHRMFEVYLDSWVAARSNCWNDFLFSKVFKELGSELDAIVNLLSNVLNIKDKQGITETLELSSARWRGSFRYLNYFQKLFLNDAVGMLLRGLLLAGCSKVKGVDALFSYGRRESPEIFSQPQNILNPVSGEEFNYSVDDLIESSARDSLEFFLVLDKVIRKEIPSSKVLTSNFVARSLNYGVRIKELKPATFFSPNGISLPRLTY